MCVCVCLYIHIHIYIHINDFQKISKMFNFIMYADDTTLFSTIKSFNDNIPNKSTQSAVNDCNNNGMA